MSRHKYFTAIILAAGISSRMGRPKQLLKVDGSTMIDHAIQAALDAGMDSPIVVLGANANQIKSSSRLLCRCTVIKNTNYREGLSRSLKSGLQSTPAQTTAYIFMLADQPLISGRLVLQMIQEFNKTRADILYPEYQGQRGNPVIISSKLRNRLLLAEGDSGAKFLFTDNSLSIVPYPINTDAVITDIDTPEDYKNICKR